MATFSNIMTTKIETKQIELAEVLALRELYRQEMNCQIVHDAWLQREFSAPYLLLHENTVAGYAAVTREGVLAAGMVHEFYLLPAYRAFAVPFMRQLLITSKATSLRAQTNDTLPTLLLYDFAQTISSEVVLFHDALTTHLAAPHALLRKLADHEKPNVFAHTTEPVGEWALEVAGEIVATGGFFTHYNPPYGDIYMEVAQPFQRRGYGSFLVQELKKICYEAGKKPAARCNANNLASRRALEKAGMLPCARILTGKVDMGKL